MSFSLYDNTPETISTTVSESTERTITPIIFQAESHSSEIISDSYQGVSEINSILNHDGFIPTFIQKADAITNTQNELSITRYVFQNNLEHGFAIDDSGNLFAGGSNKVGRIDITTNTQTTWTIPNDQSFNSRAAVDSNGFYYFTTQTSDSPTVYKIVKLNHNTDTFTEWNVKEYPLQIQINSSDDIFTRVSFRAADNTVVFLQKLDPVSNTLTFYSLPSEFTAEINSLKTQDSSGNLYFTTYKNTSSGQEHGILKFNPTTNAMTFWLSPSSNISGIAVDSTGKIYFGENFQFRQKIAELDPTTNILKEWTNPFNLHISDVIVDSSGNVFFTESFTRFVPSTNTFTKWDLSMGNNMEITSDGKIIGNYYGRISIVS